LGENGKRGMQAGCNEKKPAHILVSLYFDLYGMQSREKLKEQKDKIDCTAYKKY